MVHQAQGQLVQELATGNLPAPPSRYVLREKDRPTCGAPAPPELPFPTVDLRRLAGPGDTDEAAKLRAALQSWGLFAVTGHGMPLALLDGIREAGSEFFHLPSKQKLKHANQTEAGEFQTEGYGTDRVDTDEQVLDWCDRLYLQVQPEDARQPKLWPDHPPSLGNLLHEYALGSEQVAKKVLRAMARLLGFEDEDFFVGKKHVVGENVVGDEMEIMSNAVFRAPTHRVVVTSSEKERMSLVVFYQPEPHRDLEPAEELVDEERPARYRKVNVKAFGDGFWDAFALGEPTIDYLHARVGVDREDAA